MKKNLVSYYAIIMMGLFVFYNLGLANLRIGGLLYQILMIILIFVNVFMLIIFRKKIKYQSLVIFIYFLVWSLSKNTLQCILGISSMITLIITGFMDSRLFKVITVLITITIFFSFFKLPLLFIYLLAFSTRLIEGNERNDIYNDTHYYCENNYEVYAFSQGAMDKFHYSIGKHYEITYDILYIYLITNEMKCHEKTMKVT